MSKKWFALAVLALLVISIVPFVAADDASAEETDTSTTTESASAETSTKNKVKDVAQEKYDAAREERKKLADEKREELKTKRAGARAKVEQKKEALKALLEKAREAKKLTKEMRQEFKEKIEEIKAQRKAGHDELIEMRANLAKCAGKNDVGCMETRKQARTQASEHLMRTIENIIALLERSRERIESSDLSDEEKTKLLADIDAQLTEAGAVQDALASSVDEATQEDIKDALRVIREAGLKAKKGIALGIGKVASNKIGGILEKMEHLQTKFDRSIAKLKEQGKDTSAAEAKKAEFQAKLDSAKALHEEAKKLFESGDNPGAAEKIRAAHAELKAANEIMKALVQEIRGTGGANALEDAESSNTTTTEVKA